MNVDPVGITAVVIIALELIFWVFVGGAIESGFATNTNLEKTPGVSLKSWDCSTGFVVSPLLLSPLRLESVRCLRLNPLQHDGGGSGQHREDTEALRTTVYDNTNLFDLYDEMLSRDPELNGAVRTISLTANKYRLAGGKNQTIRNAIEELVNERLDFDDFLAPCQPHGVWQRRVETRWPHRYGHHAGPVASYHPHHHHRRT